MALFEFKLPDIGEGVMEGEIVSWLVEAGQDVREDDPMVEVMTDKATVTIGAPKTGRIEEVRAAVGAVVPVGSVIVTLALNGATSAGTVKHAAPPPADPPPAPAEAAPAQAAPTVKVDGGPAATAVGDIKETLPGTGFFQKPEPSTRPLGSAPTAASGHFDPKPLATPATRKLARDLEVDLRQVPGTGPHGRVTKDDVSSFVSAPTSAGAPAPVAAAKAPAPAAPAGRAPIAIEAPTPEQGALEDRKPFVGVRRKIAERMQLVTNTAAHFTFVEECDVGNLKWLRKRLQPAAEAAGVKLTFLPFIVKAVVAALKRAPVLNSALDESSNELVYRRYYNIGIAASTDNGLMVPVVKNADRKSILEIAAEIERLGVAAKQGTIASEDLRGSTFTITSLGKDGGLFATPILNHPEVGILGVHQIKQKPVVKDGEIVIGDVMLLSLSFDHRIVDGHVGAAFAYDIIGYLEDPDRLFLEMA
ncbi:MAG: 2-oxo acid dehydrogenase subunit E2 [Sandaracinaceae bacterium]|nr:2-oxo acid dehydrogenase subunit E2 [Sandaracinaceae bacterium]